MIFTLASVVLKPLQEGFKLTLCFPALHAMFKNLSVSVGVQLPCERGICRYLFDRGKHSAVSCVISFVQKHASERSENATSHQPDNVRTTVVPVTACASSEKQHQVASTFGSKDIAWEVVAVRLTLSLQDTTSKCFGRPLLTSANLAVPAHFSSAQRETRRAMQPHQVSCRFAVRPQHRRIKRTTR